MHADNIDDLGEATWLLRIQLLLSLMLTWNKSRLTRGVAGDGGGFNNVIPPLLIIDYLSSLGRC